MIEASKTREAEIVRIKNKTLVLVKKLDGLEIGELRFGGKGLEGMLKLVLFLSCVLGFVGLASQSAEKNKYKI